MIIAVTAFGGFCAGLIIGIGGLLWVANEPEKRIENTFKRYKRHLENKAFYTKPY